MLRKCKVLLVDNDDVSAELTRQMLIEAGCSVVINGNAQEATHSLSVEPFDLVISETELPDGNGIELLSRIKKRRGDVPVIFLTAHGEVESYLDLMNRGAFEYINKPAERGEILGVIHQALNAHEESRGVCC